MASRKRRPSAVPATPQSGSGGCAMKEKVYASLDAAVADIPDGGQIMFGGFGGAGFPNNLIQALARKGTKNITAINTNCGTREGELGLIFNNNRSTPVI